MKDYPSAFVTEKNRTDGAHPFWILRLTVASVDYWLGDSALTIPAFAGSSPWPAATAITTKHWVKQWGEIKEGISGALGDFHVAEFNLTGVIDKTAAPNLETLAKAAADEESLVELYQWFLGCEDPPQRVFTGQVRDLGNLTDTTVDLTFQDESIGLEKLHIGTLLDAETYPLADPDDIGKMIPIPFGTVEKLPALCVDSGWVTTLSAGIDESQVAVTVSELPAGSISGKVVTIDDEELLINGYDLGRINYALAGAGITATADHGNWDYLPAVTINGDRSIATGGWRPDPNTYPATLTIAWVTPVTIDEINLFFPNDSNTVPTWHQTSINGLQSASFTIQVSSNGGANWTTVAAPTTNTYCWYQALITAQAINRMRVTVNSGREFDGKTVICEFEAVGAETGVSKTLTVTRGYNGTLPVGHEKSSVVVEKKVTPLVYLCSDRALDAIGSVYARVRGILVDITADVTKYVSGFGVYAGKAAVTIADFAAVSKKISIELQNSLDVAQGWHSHQAPASNVTLPMNAFSNVTGEWTGDSGTTVTVNNTTAPPKAYDGNTTTFARQVGYYGGSMRLALSSQSQSGTPLRVRLLVTYGGEISEYVLGRADIYIGGVKVVEMPLPCDTMTTTTVHSSGWFTLTSWAGLLSSAGTYVIFTLRNAAIGIREVAWEIEVGTAAVATSATGVALTGSLGLTGNSLSDIYIGDAVLCDVTHNVTDPDAVHSYLLENYCDKPAVTLQGAFPASYAFNGAITEYEPALKILNRLAFQCRAWFAMSNGLARLIVRGDTTPVKTISACIISEDGRRQLVRRLSDRADVLSKITVLYNRDYTQTRSAKSYKQSCLVPGSTAGAEKQPDLFWFDFVTGAAMAADVGGFYLDWHQQRRWLADFPELLEHSDLEFGDVVTLGFLADTVGIVTSAAQSPGNTDTADTIKLTVTY